ncbi:unnamed protein product, partial [Closterium sp. NIES-64]
LPEATCVAPLPLLPSCNDRRRTTALSLPHALASHPTMPYVASHPTMPYVASHPTMPYVASHPTMPYVASHPTMPYVASHPTMPYVASHPTMPYVASHPTMPYVASHPTMLYVATSTAKQALWSPRTSLCAVRPLTSRPPSHLTAQLISVRTERVSLLVQRPVPVSCIPYHPHASIPHRAAPTASPPAAQHMGVRKLIAAHGGAEAHRSTWGCGSSSQHMGRTCAWDGHVPGTDMCLGRTCAWDGHVPGTDMCLGRTCAWDGHVPVTDMCLGRTCAWDGHVPGTDMCLGRTCAWDGHVPGTDMCLGRTYGGAAAHRGMQEGKGESALSGMCQECAMVVLQLILARRRVRVLVKDAKEATSGFGPYVQPIAGSVGDQAAVRAALRGSQAVIVTGRLGSLAQMLQGSKAEHVVLVSQLGASSRPSGLAGLLWSASPLAAAADAEAALAAAAVAAGGDGERGAAGEARRWGFGCTVVRGGKVVDEPGRQRGLLLGQGNTMKGSVSREDLAAVVAAALAVPPPSQHRRIIEVVNSDTPRDSNDGSDFLERIAGLSTEPIII